MTRFTEEAFGRVLLRPLVAALEASGAARDTILPALGLQEEDLSLTGARLSLRELSAACQRALAFSGDPALGLHWGERLNARSFAPVSQLLAHSDSLRRGLELLRQYEGLFCDVETFEVEEAADTASIRIVEIAFGEVELARLSAEMMTSGMLTMVRGFHAGTKPLLARFCYPAPEYGAEYERVFGAVRFGQPATELVFERALLDRPSPHADRETLAALTSVAEQQLARVRRRAPYAVQLRTFLRAHWRKRPNMTTAAQGLGLSDRSLRSHLAHENTTYREVEYGVLAAEAKTLLLEQGRSIQEAADEMGFSDSATFHRAFKSWTGMTPGEFRTGAPVRGARSSSPEDDL